MRSKALRWLRRLAVSGLLIYLGLATLVFVFQRSIIYMPSKETEEQSLRDAKANNFEAWRNANGEIIGWKRLALYSTNHQAVLVFHGNGGCATWRFSLGDQIQAIGGYDVYLLEYPGYGSRPGKPTEMNVFNAASEGVDLLKNNPLYVVGESLGTGVACYAAGKYPETVRGVFLVAPYDELAGPAHERMPYFPTRLLLLDRFLSTGHLKKYHGPVAVLIGGNDRIVPGRYGRSLYEKYSGAKKLWEIPEADHNDLFDRIDAIPRWREVFNFWNSNAASPRRNNRANVAQFIFLFRLRQL